MFNCGIILDTKPKSICKTNKTQKIGKTKLTESAKMFELNFSIVSIKLALKMVSKPSGSFTKLS